MSLITDLIDALVFPNRDVHAIPVLDGGFSPNQRLEIANRLGSKYSSPDDFALGPDGALYISCESEIIRCAGADFNERTVWATFEANVGGLAWHPAGRLLVCVSGIGVLSFSPDGHRVASLLKVSTGNLECPTAITVAADGTIYVTNGSRHHPTDRWLHDLMEAHSPTGELIETDVELRNSSVLLSGLSWPNGISLSHDETELWFTESWTHSLSAFSRETKLTRKIVSNFAGYPARITQNNAGGYWLAFFALRTQLVDFVLREREYCKKMMERIEPDLWIAPSLAATNGYLEPTQMGGIKKLGIQKMWSPPRSYGLVALIDNTGETTESFHSRVGGTAHGITAVKPVGDRVLAVSKGHNQLLDLPLFKKTLSESKA